MIYKQKTNTNREVLKYKCCLVAQGFWQKPEEHFIVSESPTPAMTVIRMALSTAAVNDMELLHHIDFEQTFLTAAIDTEMYIELPEA